MACISIFLSFCSLSKYLIFFPSFLLKSKLWIFLLACLYLFSVCLVPAICMMAFTIAAYLSVSEKNKQFQMVFLPLCLSGICNWLCLTAHTCLRYQWELQLPQLEELVMGTPSVFLLSIHVKLWVPCDHSWSLNLPC